MAFPGLLAAFRRELLVLAVLALFRTAASVQDCSQNVGNTSSLPEAQYVHSPEVEAGGLSVLYRMVHGFLDIVQPNPFPTDIAKSLMDNNEAIQNSYMKVVQYEVGYIVCTIIGILLFLLMPLIGLCFCCCRCCGRCGGKMYQEQTGSMDVRRRLLTVALFVVTSVILAGCVCMFVSNAKTSETVQESEKLLSNTLENLKLYIITIPAQVTAITNSTSIPVRFVTANLDNIGSDLGEPIKEKLGEDAYPALSAASNLAKDIQKMNDRLLLINNTMTKLIQQQEDLQQNLSVIQESINTTLHQCGANCTSSQDLVTGLTTGAKFSMIPNIDQVIIAMKKVVDSNFQSFVQEGYRAFNDTPAMVTNQSASTVSEVKKSLADIQTRVENIQEEFPILKTTGSITSEIDNINSSITKYYPQVKEANKYRWIVGIVLSCIVLLIVVCNCFGLLLGTACLKARVDPCQRNSASHAGGNFLMAGVGFSFIFFWLLILLVLILFLVGGNVYSLVCKPWYGGELFQVMEDVGLLDKFNLGETLGLNTSLNISTVYRDCQNNTSAWKALNLGLSFNLDEYLNISKYTGDISNQFEKLEVNLSGITLLDKEGKMIARDMLNTGVIGLNFTNFTQQLSLPLTQSGLLLTAQKLRNLSKIAPVPAKTELNQQAGQLEQLDRWIKSDMMPNMNTLKEKSQYLQATTSSLEEVVNTTLLKIENAQTLLQTQALDIIKNESKDFLDCQLSYFHRFVTWAREMITQDVARCKPAANALDSVATISCSYLLDSLNAFWFCMGWCTIFLIPSIIFAVKLAKFFRRMATEDVYENGDLQFEMRRLNK
ncbi:prominin-1-A-like [Hypanus sabinus]|uniref:prominin-1-A-like n=1 Tax=Hypanus sabinus TaxID=79690 RepID=UPI0028C50412|nr:prominin-1-A-like [Hypanus sabinus]XP_059803061.1 prominin-1-A-like [Hypanus sabinus]XP_059803062.1 prominin-1-A-like [Hypanus sabinus]XP_059803063.1 prominin-1-A-like [Hypanus sabinus]